MDFSAFSNPTFDSVKWIDSMIAERPEEEQLDTYITSLTMKLHVVSQEYTDQLETGMVDAASMMPRCLTEISRTQGILKTLESEMASLAIQLQEFDQRNINGVEDLSRLDTLKLNMERCKATLEEHARWSQLVREATSLLESGGRFSDSADRMEILANSLEILHNMPGHDDRLETFNSLTESLMSSLQPLVLQEVMGDNVTSLRESLYVYKKIKRSQDFIEIYTTYRPQKLENICNDCFKSTVTTSTQIPVFYGHIYGFLAEESKNIAFLYGEDEVSNLLCILLEKIMTPLQSAMVQRYKASDYSTVEEFSKRIAPLLENANDDYLFKGLSSVYACFLQNLNMLLNTEGKWIRVALEESVSSLQLGKSRTTKVAVSNNLSDTGMDFEEDDEVLDSDDVTSLFESYGSSLVTSVDVSCESVQTSLVRSLSFLGGVRARRFLRFLVPLVSQHLKTLTGKIEELRAAAELSGAGRRAVETSASSVASSAIRGDLQRYGIEDLGTTKGRVLLPSALQVFKAASLMNHQFLVLERVASEQLEKVYSQLFNDSSLKDIINKLSTNVSGDSKGSNLPSYSSSAALKDTDVSVGSALAALILRQDTEVESELKAYLIASTRLTVSSVTQSVFSASLSSLIKFKTTAEEYLFDLTTVAPKAYLKDLHLDQSWEASQVAEEGDSDMDENAVDEDNLLPQHAFTQVGEHLLSLLQELETFASCNGDATAHLIHLQDDADVLISKAWKPLRNLLELVDDDGYRNLSKRSSCYVTIAKAEQAMYGISYSTEGLVDLSVGGSELEPSLLLTEEMEEEDDVLRFVNEWLGAISDYTVGVLLVQVAQITQLSPLGRAQLRVDLTYLNNVINALGLSKHPLLSHVVLLLEQDMEKVTTQLDFIPVTTAPLSTIHKLNSRIIAAARSCPSSSIGQGATELEVDTTK